MDETLITEKRSNLEGSDNNREFWKSKCSENGLNLQHASKTIQGDKEVVLIAVDNNGLSLQFSSEELRCDKFIVLRAVEQNGDSFKYAKEVLKKDWKFVFQAIGRNIEVLDHTEFRNNRLFVLNVVKMNGLCLKRTKKEFKRDREIVLEGIKSGAPLIFAGKELRKDKEVVMAAIQRDRYGEPLKYADEVLKNDKQFVLSVIQQSESRAQAFRHSSENLKSDFEVALEAVKMNGQLLEHVGIDLRRDKRIVLEALIRKPDSEPWRVGRFEDVDRTLHKDKDFILNLVKSGYRGRIYFDDDYLMKDRDFVLEAVKRGSKEVGPFDNDHEIVFEAVKNGYRDFLFGAFGNEKRFVLEALKNGLELFMVPTSEDLNSTRYDRDVVIEAVKINGANLQYSSEFQRNDRGIVMEAVKQDGRFLRFAGEDVRNDQEIVLIAISSSGSNFQYASKSLRGKRDFVMEAVKRDGKCFQYCCETLRSDREICLEAVKSHGWALSCTNSEELRNDKEIIRTAFENNRKCIQLIGENLLQEHPLLGILKENQGDVEKAFSDHVLLFGVENKHHPQTTHPTGSEWDEYLSKFLLKEGELLNFGQIQVGYGSWNPRDFQREEEEEIDRKTKRILGKYRFKDMQFFRHLGSGASGITYLFRIEGVNGLYVAKVYNSQILSNCTVKSEELVSRDSLYLPYHPNVTTILSHVENETVKLKSFPDFDERWKEEENEEYLSGMVVMKYHRMTLRQFLRGVRTRKRSLQKLETYTILHSVVSGMHHLHSHMIVHRDLHPGNIFIEPDLGRVWVGDFGCALDLRKNPRKFLVHRGSEIMYSLYPGFTSGEFRIGGWNEAIAPEIKNFDPCGGSDYLDYEKSDLYSIGMITGEFVLPLIDTYSWVERLFYSYVRILVEKLKVEDPRKRIDFKEAIQSMREIEMLMKVGYF